MTHKHHPPLLSLGTSLFQIPLSHQTHKPKHTLQHLIRAIPWQSLTAAVAGKVEGYECGLADGGGEDRRGDGGGGGGAMVRKESLHHWPPLLAGIWPTVDEDEEVARCWRGRSCAADAVGEVVHAYAAVPTSDFGQVHSHVCEGVREAVSVLPLVFGAAFTFTL